MWTWIWTFIAVVMMLSVFVVAYFIYTAPEGYEDEDGFHYGRPDDEQ
jgi:hypothetical protein